MDYKILDLHRKFQKDLSKLSDSPWSESCELLRHSIGFASKEELIANLHNKLSEQQLERCLLNLQRRLSNEPLSYITSVREFWSLDFYVNNSTLIPRHETETLIEAFLDIFQDKGSNMQILDLGTGSGCIILSILHMYKNSFGIGVDISNEAIAVAEQNAKNLKLTNRVSFIESDWFSNINEQYDVIVSNPPYISQSDLLDTHMQVHGFEPKVALTDFADGFTNYKKIATDIKRVLKKGGIGLFEIGLGQNERVLEYFVECGLKIKRTYNDIHGIERVVSIEH